MRIVRLVLFATVILKISSFVPPASIGGPIGVEAHEHAPHTPGSTPATGQEVRHIDDWPFDPLAVRIDAEFDSSLTRDITAAAQSEAAEIWSRHGVELLWDDTGAAAVLHLELAILGRVGGATRDRSAPVLGSAAIAPSGVVCGPIRISLDRIDWLLEQRHGVRPAVHNQELGRAIGRVVAHELGHVLLGRDHDVRGLMRASFPADELADIDRHRFRLSNSSVQRLREHVARLSDGRGLQSCARSAW